MRALTAALVAREAGASEQLEQFERNFSPQIRTSAPPRKVRRGLHCHLRSSGPGEDPADGPSSQAVIVSGSDLIIVAVEEAVRPSY
jgi:hypothetical protein